MLAQGATGLQSAIVIYVQFLLRPVRRVRDIELQHTTSIRLPTDEQQFLM